MPIVHDPATGRFARGAGGGGTTAAGLSASLQKLRQQSFLASGTPRHAAIQSKIKKTEGRIQQHAEETAKLTKLRSRLFTAPKGGALHKKLSREAAASESKLANI